MESKPLVIWQAKPCPEWCVARHSDADHPEDRTHYGTDHEVTMSQQRAHDMLGGRWTLPVVRAFLAQHHREIGPRIELGNDGKAWFDLTLDEAEELTGGLSQLIAQGRRR